MRGFLTITLVILILTGCGRKAPEPPSANDVQEFHAAVQDGDATIVDRLLRAKPALANAKNASGETPLTAAKRQTDSEVAEVIRKHGGHE